MSDDTSHNSIFSSTGHWAPANSSTSSDPMAGTRHTSASLVFALKMRVPGQAPALAMPDADTTPEVASGDPQSQALFGTKLREAVRLIRGS